MDVFLTVIIRTAVIFVGGAILGSERLATVIIAKSDYPNGKLSFLQPIRKQLENPDATIVVPVTVERSEGLIGRQTVSISDFYDA